MSGHDGARLCQVALSVTHMRRTQRWYRDVLGLEPAGGTNTFRGPILSMVQGLPKVASTCWWLVDRQEDFQLELFEFSNPRSRPLMVGRRPSDIGYTTLCVHVENFDEALIRAERAGSSPLTQAIGPAGKRRVCVRDPEGVLLELMEDDPRSPTPRRRPRPQTPSAVRAVRASVPEAASGLHDSSHETLWQLEGARSRSATLWAGDILLELVQYEQPVGQPWPDDYRVSDQGILNVAFTFDTLRGYRRVARALRMAGYRFNGRPLIFGVGGLAYLSDDQGFSVEMLLLRPFLARRYGFTPRRTPRFAPFLARHEPEDPTRAGSRVGADQR